MAAPQISGNEQLTLEVGGERGDYMKSTFSMAGKVESFTEQLMRDDEIMVTVSGADGEIIFRSVGWVKGVTHETIPATEANPYVGTLRKHAIKLGEKPE